MNRCLKCRKADALDTPVDRVKSWFLHHWFGECVNDEKSASFTQGFSEGYIKGKEHELQTLKEEKAKVQSQFYMADLWSICVNPREVIIQDPKDGTVFLGPDRITGPESKQLKEEATYLKNSRLYSLFMHTVRQRAIDIGFSRSKNFEEALTGKTMVHNLEILRDIVSVCANLRDIPG